jgi:mannose-6-phosphate isomerase-like protein (cupin superfamily)
MSPAFSWDDLSHSATSHVFIGADHDVPVSMFFVHSPPGHGPKLHRHPYAELFIPHEGEATFRVGDGEVVATPGMVVIAPAGTPHGFTNTGEGELSMTTVQMTPRMETEWLEE